MEESEDVVTTYTIFNVCLIKDPETKIKRQAT